MNQSRNKNAGFNPYENNLRTVKGYFKNPIVLIYGVLSLLGLILLSVNIVMTMISFSDTFGYIDYLGSANSQVFNICLVVISVFLAIYVLVSAIWILAYFLIYFKSRNSSPTSKPNAGFAINWVFSLALVFLLSLLLVFMVIFALMCKDLFNYFEFSNTPFGMTVIYTVLIVYSIMIIFWIIYFIFNTRFWASVRSSVNGLIYKSGGSLATGILSAIVAVVLIMVVVFYFIAGNNMSSIQFGISINQGSGLINNNIFTLVINIVNALSYIVYAVLSIGYYVYIKRNAREEDNYGVQTYGYGATTPDGPIGYSYNPASYQKTDNYGENGWQPSYQGESSSFEGSGYSGAPFTNPVPSQDQTETEFLSFDKSPFVNNSDRNEKLEDDFKSSNCGESETDDYISNGDLSINTSAVDTTENPFVNAEESSAASEDNTQSSVSEDALSQSAAYDNVQPTKFCPNCGRLLTPGYKFCDKCGFRIN